MKIINSILIILICFSASFSQDSQEVLSRKLKSSLRMKSTGKYLVGFGVVASLVGVGFAVKGANEQNEYTEQFNQGNYDDLNDDGEASYQISYYCLAGGVALIGTGITLWTVGGIKSSRYKRLLDESKNEFSLNFNKHGIGLQYNF